MELIVALKDNSYPIYIKKGILNDVDKYIKNIYQGNKIMIISDDQVYSYYGERLTNVLKKEYVVDHVIVPHGEQSKRFDILPSLYKSLLEFKLTRTDLIIAVGGGLIGGKVAVDLPEGKNLIGTFYHPKMVLIDPDTLKTLPKRFINDGMAEVIKYGCIKDKNLFERLNSYKDFDDLYQDIDEIIYRCVDIKRDVVERDQFDFGDRLLLNFGHTLGHAIEQYYHYEKYSHGEAVAIGMVQLTKIAEEKNLSFKGTSDIIKDICLKYNLPIFSDTKTDDLIEAISLDKKNLNKKLSLVLLKEIGNSYVYQSDLSLIKEKDRV